MRPGAQSPAPLPKLDGLWVLLAPNEGQFESADADGKVPVLAQAGDQYYYLVAFRNAAKARAFAAANDLDGIDPRMVVGAYKDELVRVARAAGAIGMLVDYEPGTGEPVPAAPLA
ncbi:MAG: hypothetical protein R2939_13520 [Kofleriaceae bacterium]